MNRSLNRTPDFDFTVSHRAGTSMEHVDELSREPIEGGQYSNENLPFENRRVRTHSRVLLEHLRFLRVNLTPG